jgi:hypothetical protein
MTPDDLGGVLVFNVEPELSVERVQTQLSHLFHSWILLLLCFVLHVKEGI